MHTVIKSMECHFVLDCHDLNHGRFCTVNNTYRCFIFYAVIKYTSEVFCSKWWNQQFSKTIYKSDVLLIKILFILVPANNILLWFSFSKTMCTNWHGLIEKPIAPNPLRSKHLKLMNNTSQWPIQILVRAKCVRPAVST